MSGGVVASSRRSAAGVSPERTRRGPRAPRAPSRCGGVPDAGQRGPQVALDVDGQRLQRGDVQHPAPVRRYPGPGSVSSSRAAQERRLSVLPDRSGRRPARADPPDRASTRRPGRASGSRTRPGTTSRVGSLKPSRGRRCSPRHLCPRPPHKPGRWRAPETIGTCRWRSVGARTCVPSVAERHGRPEPSIDPWPARAAQVLRRLRGREGHRRRRTPGRGVRLPRPQRRGQVLDDADDRGRSPVSGGELRILGMDPAVDGPRSAPGSGSAPRRTPSTPSSTCATTSTSTAATSACPAPRCGAGRRAAGVRRS